MDGAVRQENSWKLAVKGVTRIVPDLSLDDLICSRNGLRRIIYYGEALRAVSTYLSNDLIDGPFEPIVAQLSDAFDRLAAERPGFTPEEFTLYFMSVLLGLSEDPEETRKIKLGSARYILKSAAALPAEFNLIVKDARALLAAQASDAEYSPKPARAHPSGQVSRPIPSWMLLTNFEPSDERSLDPDRQIPTAAPLPTKPREPARPKTINANPGSQYRRSRRELLRSEAISRGATGAKWMPFRILFIAAVWVFFVFYLVAAV